MSCGCSIRINNKNSPLPKSSKKCLADKKGNLRGCEVGKRPLTWQSGKQVIHYN